MSNWFNNLGFNHIQRTQLPSGNTPANPNVPANNTPTFTGNHGVDRFEPSNKLIEPTNNSSVRDIVGSVSKLPVSEKSIVEGGHLSKGTFETMKNPPYEFPPI